jgi:hypothetical protein
MVEKDEKGMLCCVGMKKNAKESSRYMKHRNLPMIIFGVCNTNIKEIERWKNLITIPTRIK